jgi:hypothetical protein
MMGRISGFSPNLENMTVKLIPYILKEEPDGNPQSEND